LTDCEAYREEREPMSAGFGVVGVGTWGETHAKVYAAHPDARLVAVCDVNEQRARQVAEQYGAESAYTDFEEVMADPGVEAVSIATPDFAHLAPVQSAAAHGKHILVEKPLATTVEDAEKICDVVRDAGVKAMVDFHNRWNPTMYEAKQIVERGEIGYPVSAYMKLQDTIYVPTKMLSWSARSSVLWFIGSHGLDLLRWILGDEVRTVYSVSRSRVLKGMGIATPDFYHTILQFKNGPVAIMDAGWVLPETEPFTGDFKFDLVGSEGAVIIDCTHNRTIQKYTKDEAIYPFLSASMEMYGKLQGFTLESIRHFVECVVEDEQPLVGLEDGLINTRVLAAAERSAETGLPIEL